MLKLKNPAMKEAELALEHASGVFEPLGANLLGYGLATDASGTPIVTVDLHSKTSKKLRSAIPDRIGRFRVETRNFARAKSI